MYPTQELKRLAAHKALLQRKSARRRVQCADATASLIRPLLWLDETLGFWRGISPLVKAAALPLGFVVARKFFPRVKLLRSLVRWGPLAFSAARGVSSLLSRNNPVGR